MSDNQIVSTPQQTVGDVMPDGQPRPNLPLLRKVLDHIDAHPEEWDQRLFAPQVGACGSTYCIAGHAVAMSVGVRRARYAQSGDYAVEPADGRDWETSGRDALGLTRLEASKLFYGTIGHDEGARDLVQQIAEQIAARGGEVL